MEDPELGDWTQSESPGVCSATSAPCPTAWPSELLSLCGPLQIFDGEKLQPRLTTPDRARYTALEAEARTRTWATDPLSQPEIKKRSIFLARHDDQLRKAAEALDTNFSQQALLQWLSDAAAGGVSEDKASELLRLMANKDFQPGRVGFTSVPQFHRACADSLPDMTGAYETPITIPGNDGHDVTLTFANGKPANLYYHNMWEQLLLMFRDPVFAASTSLFPDPCYQDPGDPASDRVFSGFMSGLLCQALYQTAPKGSGVLIGQLYSDESALGAKDSAYPFYCELAAHGDALPCISLLQSRPDDTLSAQAPS